MNISPGIARDESFKYKEMFMSFKSTYKDPVCHMEVSSALFSANYAGINYVFCSAQCKERFEANPKLYVGVPGRKAVAQQGERVIKKRTLLLLEPLNKEQAEQVKNAFLTMMGVEEVVVEGNKMTIQYDLIQATAEQIAKQMALIDTELGGGWVERLRLGFINYQEECEIGNLELRRGTACH